MASTTTIEYGVACCDERIASAKSKIENLRTMEMVLSLVKLDLQPKHQRQITIHNNIIQLIKIEKLLYKSLANPRRELYPKLLAKYSEMLSDTLELIREQVVLGEEPETFYLDYSAKLLTQQEYISKLCKGYGEM